MARARTKTNRRGKGWFGERRRHSSAAKDGWKGRVRTTTTTNKPQIDLGPVDVETIHAKRSKFSQQMDYKFNANHTYSKFDPQGRAIWAKAPNRNDIEGLDTIPGKGEIEQDPEKEKKPKKKPEEKEGSHPHPDPEHDDFFKNYPEEKITIPHDYDDDDMKLMDRASHYRTVSDGKKPMPISWYVSNYSTGPEGEKQTLQTVKRLEKKGYVKIIKDKAGKQYVEIVDGGYARLMHERKGDYADKIYGKLHKGNEKNIELTKQQRDQQIKDIAAQCTAINTSIEQNRLRSSTRSKMERMIPKYKKQAQLLKSNKMEFLGNKKLSADAKYVLDTYFDIDPKTLSNNVLNFEYSPSYQFAGRMQRRKDGITTGPAVERQTLFISSRYFKNSDIKTDKSYLDTMIHELIHWQRNVDNRRLVDPVNLTATSYQTMRDQDIEEKHTTMETSMRIGDDAPDGKVSYYGFLKSVNREDNPIKRDNKILTISPTLKKDTKIGQIGENMALRKNTSLLHRLQIKGQKEWVDTFYETRNSVNQVYNPHPPKNFSSKNIAREIEMEDRILGNETVYEWRDGKKHLILKKGSAV
jgi:hypothetical protein